MSDAETIERPRRRLQQVQRFKEQNDHWPHTTLYRWATIRPGLIVKMGRASLVDLDVVDEIEATFPPANIRIGLGQAAAQQAAAPEAAPDPRWNPPQSPAPAVARRAAPVRRRLTASSSEEQLL